MAKSTNFFGLRRGSTKAHTFQVYRGMQITKDRVTAVSNPQSDAQMQQRLKLPVVSEARSVLRDLVNHSWEGVNYGEESLKKFSTRNLEKGALTIKSYVPKGIMDTGVSDLCISDGSLSNAYQFSAIARAKEDNVYSCASVEIYNFKSLAAIGKVYNENAQLDADAIIWIENTLGLDANDQLTFLLQRSTDEYNWADSSDNEYVGYYHRFTVSRLIMDAEKSTAWKFVKATTAADTDITITDGFMRINISHDGANEVEVAVGYETPAYNKKVVAGCCIFSRQIDNVWRRSPARLILIDDNTEFSTNDYNTVVSTYLKSTTASSRYLNTGTEGVNITGGN